jgi:hypothetical protein
VLEGGVLGEGTLQEGEVLEEGPQSGVPQRKRDLLLKQPEWGPVFCPGDLGVMGEPPGMWTQSVQMLVVVSKATNSPRFV